MTTRHLSLRTRDMSLRVGSVQCPWERISETCHCERREAISVGGTVPRVAGLPVVWHEFRQRRVRNV